METKLTTEYTIYFLQTNRAPMSDNQQVLSRNQDYELNMPGSFSSEAEAIAWAKQNGPAMARKGEFVILPVHRMGY